MTNASQNEASRPSRRQRGPIKASMIRKGLFNTIPIVLAGSMAMSMNFPAPAASVEAKRPGGDRTTPSELGKNIREALAAAHTASLAEATSAGVVTTAAAPASYTVVAGDSISGIAGRFGIATASVLALNGLGWKSVIFPGQVIKLTGATVTPIKTPTASTANPGRYKVVAGDTISKIAAKHGVSTQAVLTANGLGWSSLIYAGSTLAIPGASAPAAVKEAPIAPVAAVTPAAPTQTPAPPKSGTHVIKAGDTIGMVAAKYGVSTQAMLAANGLGWSSVIYPGRVLSIPGSSAPTALAEVPIVPAVSITTIAANPATHVIASGETLASIAKKYSVTIQGILNANGLTWSSIIYGGRSLVIPAPAPAPTGTRVTPLDAPMTENAELIIGVGTSLGVSDYGIVIALATAMQESSLRNLNYGDRDSLGLFQQRPSTGWGTPAQVTDRVHSTKLFFGGPTAPNRGITRGLLDIPGWQSMTVTQAAQAVQISGHPDAYAKWEVSAWAWLDQLR
ncbi:LysM repeat protein [Marisediminicola sp. UYEF4]|uniref:muramidase family protein n=1 Tax=Marisediminicola sp. UYEF4 TaxID=1756384 RepID=UPI00339A424F